MRFVVYSLLLLVFLLYVGIRFVHVLIKMRKPVVFPVTVEDWEAIRMQPKKPIGRLAVSNQKTAVWIHSLFILIFTALVLYELFTPKCNTLFLFVFIPSLLNLPKLWNLFAVQEDGVLAGQRFVPWDRMQSYAFIPIDIHHRFYGYSPELNEGYELMIQTKWSEVSCLVTSEAVKEKLAQLLDENLD